MRTTTTLLDALRAASAAGDHEAALLVPVFEAWVSLSSDASHPASPAALPGETVSCRQYRYRASGVDRPVAHCWQQCVSRGGSDQVPPQHMWTVTTSKPTPLSRPCMLWTCRPPRTHEAAVARPSGSDRNVPPHPLDDRRGRRRTRLACEFAPALQQHQGRDAADRVARRERGLGLGIDSSEQTRASSAVAESVKIRFERPDIVGRGGGSRLNRRARTPLCRRPARPRRPRPVRS